MKKIKVLTVIFLVLTLMLGSVQTFASNRAAIKFADVKDDYWGKASIDYVSSKGYMVGYGKEFGILDSITEGQYLAVLCRIFGYTNQSPTTVEGPARELGLVRPTDVVNITSNLKRGSIAKYTIRAFEMLNKDVVYPDYLEAYHSMVGDYENLSGELKPIVLKCIEKGLLAGGADGNFNPNDYTTRAQAAAFIHRLMEQSERDKVKPIFAKPDPEFEAFMNSPEASNYIQTYNYIKVVDGKVIWTDFGGKKQYLLPTYHYKEINKDVYNSLKALMHYAKQNNNYVYAFINTSTSGQMPVIIQYYASKRRGFSASEFVNFRLLIESSYAKIPGNDGQKYSADFVWDIVSLGSSDTYEWTEEELYRTKSTLEEFKAPLRALYNVLYPPNVAEFIYNHTISEWNITWDMEVNDYFEENVFSKYYPDLNLELYNNRSESTRRVFFFTNRVD